MRYEWHVGVVTDTKLYGRTGDVGRWAASVERQFTRHAIAKAPHGAASGRDRKSRANAAYPPGSMKANIFGQVSRVGPRQLQTLIYVDVPYALYVIKGTPPVIWSKSARTAGGQFAELGGEEATGMYLPANSAGPQMFRQRVRGQRPNNFLGEAFDATARTHSSLRGYQMIS
jgi:hypothetical protein